MIDRIRDRVLSRAPRRGVGLIAACIACATLCAESAAAQTLSQSETTRVERPARGRLGVGGYSAYMNEPSGPAAGGGHFGMYLRIGRQFSDLLGLHLDVGGSTLFVTLLARSALIVDLTFADRFSIGTGVAVNYYGHEDISFLGRNRPWESGWMVGVPVHLSFKDPLRRDAHARRGFGVSVDGDLGSSLSGGFVYGVHLTIGYEAY